MALLKFKFCAFWSDVGIEVEFPRDQGVAGPATRVITGDNDEVCGVHILSTAATRIRPIRGGRFHLSG